MDMWLIILLVVLGVFLLIEVGLVLAGKTALAKKLVFPFLAVVGALGVGKVLAGSASAIKKENERIKNALKEIERERDDLRNQLDQATKAHTKKVAALQGKINESDARAKGLKDEIDTMKANGPEEWFNKLPDERKREIIKKASPPGLEDQFLNP